MKKELFAIVGYTNWGKSNTLYDLFDKRQFFPLKSPISSARFGNKKFTVINASNEDRYTKDYLDRLEDVLKRHSVSDSVIVITISLMFNEANDVRPVLDYLNGLIDYHINYIIIEKGWHGGVLKTEDTNLLKQMVTRGELNYFDLDINESSQNFKYRSEQIAKLIREVIL